MISWLHIIDIGHSAFMVPMAGAIAVWLVCTNAWRLAFRWCVIFVTGLALVALSKVAFLGWGREIGSISFQALSGHAWRSTAVLPVLFFVILQSAPGGWRIGGLLFGVALSIGLGALLVNFGFHTAAEVIASSVLGICAAFLFVRAALSLPPPRINRWVVPASLTAFVLVSALKPASINHRLVDVALFFSGRDDPYRWSQSPDLQVRRSFAPKRATGECRVPGVD